MKPSAILNARMNYFKSDNSVGLYNLYAKSSDFFRFFPTLDEYEKNISLILADNYPVSIEIVNEIIREDIAEVLYIESFRQTDDIVKYYTKTKFILENNLWRILSEKREKILKP